MPSRILLKYQAISSLHRIAACWILGSYLEGDLAALKVHVSVRDRRRLISREHISVLATFMTFAGSHKTAPLPFVIRLELFFVGLSVEYSAMAKVQACSTSLALNVTSKLYFLAGAFVGTLDGIYLIVLQIFDLLKEVASVASAKVCGVPYMPTLFGAWFQVFFAFDAV